MSRHWIVLDCIRRLTRVADATRFEPEDSLGEDSLGESGVKRTKKNVKKEGRKEEKKTTFRKKKIIYRHI